MSLIFQNGSYTRGLDQWATPNPKQATSGASRTSLNPQKQSASQSPDERVTQPTPGKSLDMSSYRPGQAQPVQQQSRGTPYGQSATNQPFTNAPATPQSYQDSAYGKFANSQGFFQQPVGPSLAPFQMSAAQTPWGPSMDPFVERDAIIRALNEQRMQRQVAFNTGGPAPVNAGAMPWLDYGAAIQQAGLGQGSPSMSQGSGDSLIERLNQQFGQPAPTAYYPGFNPQTQNPYGQPGPRVEWLPPTLNGYGGRGQQAAPGYGTPPEKRGLGRTANWIDKDRDGVDDRDQDGPGMPSYDGNQQPAPPWVGSGGYNPGRGVMPGPAGPPPAQGSNPGSSGLGYADWVRAGSPGSSLINTMDVQALIDATGQQVSGSSTELGAYRKWVESQGGSLPGGRPPIHLPGPPPYDSSRFGDGTLPGRAQPIPPPSHGTPYQPTGPKAVDDVTKLPFYKNLFVGDTVRASPRRAGEYDVFDSSGRHVESYVGDTRSLYQGPKGGRTGNRMYDITPEGAAENARLFEESKKKNDALQASRVADAVKEYEFMKGEAGRMKSANYSGPAGGNEYRVRNDALRRNINELFPHLPKHIQKDALLTGFVRF